MIKPHSANLSFSSGLINWKAEQTILNQKKDKRTVNGLSSHEGEVHKQVNPSISDFNGILLKAFH